MWTFIGLPFPSAGLNTRLGLTQFGSRLGSTRELVWFGSARLGTALFGAWLGSSSLGSGLGYKLGFTRFSPGSELFSSWAGKKVLIHWQVRVKISTARFFWSPSAVLIRLASKGNKPKYFPSRIGQSRLNRFWTRLGSARLRSAGYPGSSLDSWLRLDLVLRIWARGSTRCLAPSAQLGALFGLSSCIDSGLATRDLALLCLELRSAYLDRRLARLILAKLIRLAIIFFIKETIHRRKKCETKTDRTENS